MSAHTNVLFLLVALVGGSVAGTSVNEKCGPYQGMRIDGNGQTGALSEILRKHHRWLEKYGEKEQPASDSDGDAVRANLCGADLRGTSFFAEVLTLADFSQSDLTSQVSPPSRQR